MTPKEKAIELFDKFKDEFNWVEKDYNIDLYRDTKQCALIAVDEILDDGNASSPFEEYRIMYWNEVKKEIQNL